MPVHQFLSRRLTWLIWAVTNLIGVALIALPDSDNRVISFSRTHGPAPSDLAGTIILVIGWVALNLRTWRHRKGMANLGVVRLVFMFLVPAALGTALLSWSVSRDRGVWWLLGAGMVAAVQVAAAVIAGKETGIP